jgi:hypothetical protein
MLIFIRNPRLPSFGIAGSFPGEFGAAMAGLGIPFAEKSESIVIIYYLSGLAALHPFLTRPLFDDDTFRQFSG